MNPCPDREQLELLLAELLDAGKHDALSAHIADCSDCQEILARLTDLPELPAPSAAESEEPDPRFLNSLQRLASQTLGADTVNGSFGLRFPGEATPLGPLGRLGRYHIAEQIGWGAAGFVFRAHDEHLNRTVALKVLRPELAVSADSRTRFIHEAQTAAALQHEHIVAIFEAASLPDFPLPFLVLEFIDGSTLAERLKEVGRFEPDQAARLVRQAALGLGHAHERGLVHRDLKPANLLLDKATGRVKITDFGLARAVEPSDLVRSTLFGSVAGTPAYMSPEQFRTPDRVDARSDVYSLGVVLYELLTGEPPFRGTTPAWIMQQVVHEEPASPRRCNAAVPTDLEAIVRNCLAKDPTDRYRNAAELAVDLERYLACAPLRGLPGGPRRLLRWSRRHPSLAVTVTFALAALIGLVLLAFLYQRERDARKVAASDYQVLLAERTIDRGVALCEHGDVGAGLLWFARALEMAPSGAERTAWSARTQLATWRRQQPALRAVFPHEGSVDAVAFNRDGTRFLTGSPGNTARLWDTATGRLLATLPAEASVTAVAFAADQQTLLGRQQGIVLFWEPLADGTSYRDARRTSAGQLFQDTYQGHNATAAFSADGRVLLTVDRTGNARLWDVGSRRTMRSAWMMPGPVQLLALSPDGSTVATNSGDGSVHLWEAATGQARALPCVHSEGVTGLAFCPDGRRLLTGCKDHTARLWDATTGASAGPVIRHRDRVNGIGFSPDGAEVITAGNDHYLSFFDSADGSLAAFCCHPAPVRALVVHPDGQRVLSGCEDGALRLWQRSDARPREQTIVRTNPVEWACFRPGGESFAVGCTIETCSLWRVASGVAEQDPQWKVSLRGPLAFSPDGRRLLASRVRAMQLLDASTGEAQPVQLPHPGEVRCCAWSSDGKWVLIGGEDGTARLWDAVTWRMSGFALHPAPVTTLAFDPDGKGFLSGCRDGTAHLWTVPDCARRGEPLHHCGAVTAVAFRPDGETFVTASRGGGAQVWHTHSRQPLGPPLEHPLAVLSVAFSGDGRILATGSEDRKVRFWEAESGRPLGPPRPHATVVAAVAFHPNGRQLLTAGDPRRVLFWPVPQPAEGKVDQVILEAQIATGRELGLGGQVRTLRVTDWQQRQRRLQK